MVQASEIKTCPKCGREFECFSDDDCWCEKLQIHRKDYLEIIQKYDDCLCADCLIDYAEE
ncbi:MAG: cysteine-rich CWC family protein [Bacteroidales bacterium]|nr:cysteine-rich CWC family protein [Bacteroidales bacterium]